VIQLEKRYKTFNGYTFDRYIFKSMMYVIISVMLLFAWANSFNLDYYKCSAPKTGETLCKNKFYTPSTWKNEEYLPVGEYGKNPSEWFSMILGIIITLIMISFVANHVAYNRGFRL